MRKQQEFDPKERRELPKTDDDLTLAYIVRKVEAATSCDQRVIYSPIGQPFSYAILMRCRSEKGLILERSAHEACYGFYFQIPRE
jgi:hypothetical protein